MTTREIERSFQREVSALARDQWGYPLLTPQRSRVADAVKGALLGLIGVGLVFGAYNAWVRW